MSTRAERVERLFHAASELPGEERAGFLARACPDDGAVRREVETLLGHDAADDDRLDRAAPEVLALARRPSNLLVGRDLGPYHLERCLASGGMGSVYEATQESPRRTVALKVLRSDIATEELARRFRVESSFLARLQHPAIAHVYEAGVAELDGRRVPFIAMELVPGARPITAAARELGLEQRLSLFAEVCDAVQHGHQRGVIHRDLKPANILVDDAGRPKLIDFGVARAVDPSGETSRTEAGVFLGTLQYMSPEQCLDARDLDVRSDVYSLGVVLYELVCGRLPHDLAGAALPEAARIVRERPPRRPSTALRAARGDLETVLLTAIAREKEQRYQSAAELAADLRRHVRHEPIEARAPSVVHRLLLFARRQKVLVGSLAAVFLVLAAATVISLRFALGESRARHREERSSTLANLTAADLLLRSHDAAGARRRLEAIPPARRGFEWSYLFGQLDLALGIVRGPHLRCEAIDWSAGRIASAWHYPDGNAIRVFDPGSGRVLAGCDDLESVPTRLATLPDGSIVWGGSDGGLRRWRPEGDASELLAPPQRGVVTAVCTARGRVLSASMDGSVRAWDLASGGHDELVQGGEPWRDLAVAPDGRHAAAAGQAGSVLWLDLVAGGAGRRLEGTGASLLCVAIDPTGTVVAGGAADGTIRVWDVASGERRARLAGHEAEVQDLAFLPGGELVSASADRTLRVWDLATGAARSVLFGHEGPAKCLAVRGDRLASGAYDGTLRIWDPAREAGGRRVEGHAAFVRELAFAPDGELLATASVDGTAKLIDVASGRARDTLVGHAERLTAVAFHPDGASLATASMDGSVRIWDRRTGEALRVLEQGGGGVLALAFAPRGDLLATLSRDGRVVLRDARTFDPRREWRLAAGAEGLAFDPAGERLAVANAASELSLWDARRGEELWRLVSDVPLHDVAFAPDGRRLATGEGGYDGSGLRVRLFDAATGEERARLLGHTDIVIAVAFSPDGSRLASASADGTVRLWDGQSGDELLTLHGHHGWVWSVAFSPDGTRLASSAGSQDPTSAGAEVRLWEAAPPAAAR